jgi:multiple sugar transport system permease protein
MTQVLRPTERPTGRLIGRRQRRVRWTRRRRAQAFAGWFFALPVALALLLVLAVPVLNAVRLSFSSVTGLGQPDQFVGLDNFRAALGDRSLWRVFTNTVVWTIGSVAGQLALGLLAALAINRKVRGIQFFRSIMLMPYVVPAVALALLVRWLLDSRYGLVSFGLQEIGLLAPDTSPLGLTSTAMLAVVIANVWRGFPFAMLIYWAALQSIDQSQYEAAKVDGAGWWHEFRYVTLPNLRSATIALFVLRGIWSVTYFDLVYLTTGGGPTGATETWPVWIYNTALGSFNFGLASAIATLMAAVLTVVIVIYVKATGYGREGRQ